jgi:hypothetical protein
MVDENKATFAVELKDETSDPAHTAATALEMLKAKIDADTKAMRGAQAAMARLKAAGMGSSKAVAVLKAQIDRQKKSIGQAQEHFISLGGTFDAVKKDATAGAGVLDNMKEVLRAAGPPGNALAGVLDKVSGGMVGVVGIVTVAIGVLATLTATIARATIALAHYAVTVADTRRAEQLRLEGMLRWSHVQRGIAVTSSNELQSAIDQVTDSTALGRDEIARYATQIARSGVRGQALTEILEVMSQTASAAGEDAANTFRDQAVYAARAGASIKGLAGVWRHRFGDIATAQANSLDRQMTRLHENISQLFSGIRINGLLSAIHRVLSLFSQTTQTGRSLRALITTIARVLGHDLVGDSRNAGETLRNMFRDLVILVQRVVIQFLRMRLTVRSVFASVGRAVEGFMNIGGAIVDGMVAGIRAAWSRVTSTVQELTDALPDVVRNALGIHSPSKVFARLGVQIPRGLEEGIEQGSRGANAAAAAIVIPPTEAPAAPATRSQRSGSVVQVTFGDVHIQGGHDAREQAQSFVDHVISLLEGAGIQMGAPVPTP